MPESLVPRVRLLTPFHRLTAQSLQFVVQSCEFGLKGQAEVNLLGKGPLQLIYSRLQGQHPS